MLTRIQNIPVYNKQITADIADTPSKRVSQPIIDTVSFRGQPLSAKQAVKFLIPVTLGAMGITQFLPKFLMNKIFDIEIEDYKYKLIGRYGTSRIEEINSQISDIQQIAGQNHDKLRIIENLVRKDVFESLGNVNSLTPDKPELFDKQLEFLDKMVKNKKYVRHVCASNVHNHKTGKLYSIKDFEAKEKMIDYLQDFNRRYEASARWIIDKLNSDSWTIGYKQVDIINATNAFNLDLMMEMVKSKTTFIDNICPPDEVLAYDLSGIGYNINDKNIDYIRKMFRDNNVSKRAIIGLSEWIDKKSMTQYKKINQNSNIPKKFIGEIGAILNDFNYDFVMSLVQNQNISKDDIAKLGKYYNEQSASVLKYLVKHIQDNRIKYSKKEIGRIAYNIKKENKEYIEKLCKNNRIPLEVVSEVANIVNDNNIDLIINLGVDEYNYAKEVRKCANNVTGKNRKFVETLCYEHQMKAKDLIGILENLYYLENIPLKLLDFNTKCSILNTHAKYGELMKKCGIDFEKKVKEIADSIQTNIECTQSENLKGFLFKILANNNPEAEEVLKTYDFAQFGKEGIPLEYPRKDFVENLEENILSGIKAEDKRAILEHHGIIENEDYDGLWNNQEIDKTTLISEKGRIASDKTKAEIDKFMLKNSAISKDSKFNEIINDLIKGIPSFVPLIGKIQHSTHDYSVDIHTLKVLQSCMNNPLYEQLSDEGKTILKISALLHDIGKNGKVRDSGHTQKSAEYVSSILKTINMPKDVKRRIINIIANHHWFADYNSNKINSKNVATLCRLKEDLLIYQILAKADLENVSNSFHFGVTGTKNNSEYSQYFDKKVESTKNTLEKVLQNANIIFHTKILNNGDKFPREEVTLKNGKKLKVKVLNLNRFSYEADLEQYGFPKGTTIKNLRFLVHMTKSGTNFDVAAALISSDKNSSAWSTSLISTENPETYGSSPYGFVFDVGQENISEAYYQNTGSGNHKDIHDFEKILFDFGNKERIFVRNNLKKELKKHGIWLSESEYGNLVNYLEKKKHITAIRKDVKIENRTIKAKTLVKCLEKSRDSLFKEYEWGHNEVVVINPKIQALITKYKSIKECNDDFIMFAAKHNLPIIVMG